VAAGGLRHRRRGGVLVVRLGCWLSPRAGREGANSTLAVLHLGADVFGAAPATRRPPPLTAARSPAARRHPQAPASCQTAPCCS
jgi:hypothetical protein